ncbi:MAG: DUF3048 domain-containing protein [Anaerolineae bacterium]
MNAGQLLAYWVRGTLMATLCWMLAGCLTNAAPESTEPTPLPGARVVIIVTATPSPIPGSINPLTGLAVADTSVLARRPVVVKISNAPAIVRPQAGISAADIVYEHYVEGGLTRFSAVFYSQAPQRVGSIRSARLIDANQLVPMYHALLAFSGASTGVEQIIYGSDYAQRTYKGVLYGAPYYWRDEIHRSAAQYVPQSGGAVVAGLAGRHGYAVRPQRHDV